MTPDIGLTFAIEKRCDDLGLDIISTVGVIGFAYGLYERGIITNKDTGGAEFRLLTPLVGQTRLLRNQ